jgi:hypothetical protein
MPARRRRPLLDFHVDCLDDDDNLTGAKGGSLLRLEEHL